MRKFNTALLSTVALLAGISVQSATAADLAVKAPPPPAPIVSRWDGLYASFSAGGTWTDANSSFSRTSTNTSTNSQFINIFQNVPFGTPLNQSINTTQTNSSDSLTGDEIGAVFTFAMGYNVVWGRWLGGIQSEVSLNRNNIRLEGAGQTTTNSTNFFQRFAIPNVQDPLSQVTITNQNQNFTTFFNLENKWTISEMVRIGYLVTPDWLIYGLVGWSWGGFEAFSGDTPFTLNGLTYGAGVEKDFGWLRAFVQYKGINYDSKGVNFSSPFSSNQTSINPQAQTFSTFSQNTADSAARSFSADVHQVTAGITVPINFNRW